MNIKHLICIATLATPFSATADFLSVSAGGGIWNETPDGNFQKTSDPAAVDLKDSLFWESEAQGYLFATFEHFVPLVPNVRLMYTNLDHSGNGDSSFTFDGQNFSGNISNDFAIEMFDILAYYEVLDNIVSLDIGLNIRNLESDYTITSDGTLGTPGATVTDSFDQTIPMLYVAVGASPWPDLLISGEISYTSYSGSSISDFTAKIAYTTNFFLGFEAGYRAQSFEFDDVSGTDAKIDFDGVFAGAYLKF